MKADGYGSFVMTGGIPMRSSFIRKVQHIKRLNALFIEFTSGGLYQYRGFTAAAFGRFLKAKSAGRYFHRNIRGKYKYERIS